MIIKFLAQKLLVKHLQLRKFIAVSCYHSNLHQKSFSTDSPDSPFKLDDETVRLLEKLSLVNFENSKNKAVVESAIEFADGINAINTDNVEPLVTVLEDCSLRLREDVVTDGKCKKEILQNATVVDEGYFVAPSGNIPVNLQKLKKE